MGNDISNQISKDDLIQIKHKQLLLEEQNRKISNELLKEKRKKAELKQDINELKTSMNTTKSKHIPKNKEKVTVTINKSTLQVDPYHIFGLDTECTLNDIKKVYKQLIIKYHPDKSGYDSANDYKTIQKAYAILLSIKEEESKMSGLLIQTIESKRDQRNQLDSHIETTNHHFQPQSGSKFDNSKFNDMFNKTKFIENEDDDGYSKWMRDEIVESTQPKISSYTKDGFNQAFENHAKQQSNNKELSQFIEPDSYFTYGGGFENLCDSIADFSSDGKYTDLKKAYSQANILHPGEIKPREQYTNINQLKASRDAPIELTLQEKEFLESKKSRELQSENARYSRMQEKDKRIDEFYTRVHGRTIELPTYKRT